MEQKVNPTRLDSLYSLILFDTIAVAAVLSNWHTVLQAINMASSTSQTSPAITPIDLYATAKIPKPKIPEGGDATTISSGTTLPQTLVRIPAEQEPSQSTHQEIASKNT